MRRATISGQPFAVSTVGSVVRSHVHVARVVIVLRGMRRGVVTLSYCAAVSACAGCDARVPWDTNQMAREIALDLQQFENVDAEFREVEVLAWRRVERHQPRPAPLDPLRFRSYGALVWVRAEGRGGVPAWLLVQAGGGQDEPWRRAIIFRELKAPLTNPRPGEDTTGTWHGFSRYTTPPTSEQVCDFAGVAFLKPYWLSDVRVVVTDLRRHAWQRVTGAAPVCRMDE